jgi:hypothetical protein
LLEKWLFLNNQAKIPSRSFNSYKPYHAKVTTFGTIHGTIEISSVMRVVFEFGSE